jgi:RNA-binding protein
MSSDFQKQARALPVLLQVGKNGLSEGFLDELKLLVEKKGLVKVRFLKSFADINDVKHAVRTVADDLSLQIVLIIGNTVVFSKQ